VTLPAEFGNNDIPDVTAHAQQKVVEQVPERRAPDNSFAVESKQQCGAHYGPEVRRFANPERASHRADRSQNVRRSQKLK
jgi:hypothetical protein